MAQCVRLVSATKAAFTAIHIATVQTHTAARHLQQIRPGPQAPVSDKRGSLCANPLHRSHPLRRYQAYCGNAVPMTSTLPVWAFYRADLLAVRDWVWMILDFMSVVVV